MKNLRKYGKSPYEVAVVHGGPGAPGEMAPVAKELSLLTGVLEPLQTADSLEGQVREPPLLHRVTCHIFLDFSYFFLTKLILLIS
jgi:hypothetical protein